MCTRVSLFLHRTALQKQCVLTAGNAGAWVYEDINSDDYDTDTGYTPAPPGPLNPASGLLSGLNRALGRGGAQQGSAGPGQDPGEVYFAPQQVCICLVPHPPPEQSTERE
jgi:hypothetical protein